MIGKTSPKELDALLSGTSPFALIDVREPGEYNSTHISGSSLIPRRQLESSMFDSVPLKDVLIVVCDDDGRRAALAATTIERMGYSQVSVLEGGINNWMGQNYPTEWGVNVPSKDFGEKVEVLHHVPEIDADDLHARIERGDELVILDTRTPEEYQRFCIPGGRSVPGAELALRITDLTRELSDDATVIVNCAGRTRSIIGTRILQRMGLNNVFGLKNGTSGWVLAGYELETGADRVELPDTSQEGVAVAEEFADRIAKEDGVRFLDVGGLQSLIAKSNEQTVYLVDLRSIEEYESGHIPGFRWFPGGQAVQRSDELAVVKNATIVFACDGKARAAITASWFRQMDFQDVYAVDGGSGAWESAGFELEKGHSAPLPFGLDEARNRVRLVSPGKLREAEGVTTIFVDTSQDFSRGHVPGSHWIPRGWLEIRIADFVASKDTPIAVTCVDGVNAALAGATLLELGYADVSVLDGGVAAWRSEGFPIEQGLTGVMSAPTDVLVSGPDRNFADMMNYLRWEEELGKKYESQ